MEPVTGDRPRSSSAVWGGPFILGLLMMVLGVIALGTAFLTSLVTIIVYGALLVGVGIAEAVSALTLSRIDPGLLSRNGPPAP